MLKGLLSNQNRTIKTAIIIDELGALNQLPSLHRYLVKVVSTWAVRFSELKLKPKLPRFMARRIRALFYREQRLS